MKVEFGALLEPCPLAWDGGEVEPLINLNEIKTSLLQPSCYHNGWLYPPLGYTGNSDESPLKPTSFFLPATHQLTLEGDDYEKANFLIALLGMLKGLRLQRADWLHFYKTPLLVGKLNDFVASRQEIERTLSIASAFWEQHQEPEIRKLIFGALHWHLFAQLYDHEFERFNAQYSALDACSKLAVELEVSGYQKQPPHIERPEKLCGALGIQLPAWAKICGRKCDLSERRNALVHEAMYAGLPVGFAFQEDHGAMALELPGFVARIYLRLLNIKNEYTDSSCATRQKIVFAFPCSNN